MERIRAGAAVLVDLAFTASVVFVALLLEAMDVIAFVAHVIFVLVVALALRSVGQTWGNIRAAYV